MHQLDLNRRMFEIVRVLKTEWSVFKIERENDPDSFDSTGLLWRTWPRVEPRGG